MLGPGIGGFEREVIALVALIVVGPKDLPVLMRKVGQFLGRARKMAAEFRASFDDMARQSELDDLRKEVEALRSGQVASFETGTKETFKQIDSELKKPFGETVPAKVLKPETPEIEAATQAPPTAEPGPPEPTVAAKPTPRPRKKASKPAKARAPRKKAGA